MKSKNYMITQANGDVKDKRRVYPRRDANCPVIARVRQREREEQIDVPCWLLNLSEDGCLITSDYFPHKVEDISLSIPGVPSIVRGKARAQGEYTINIKFAKLLKIETVNMIGRIRMIPNKAAMPSGTRKQRS